MACRARLVGAVTRIPESQVEVDAGQIEAAVPAVTFWPDDPVVLRGPLRRPPKSEREMIKEMINRKAG
jgi:hypothetical protein